jgi:hypothetical protein
MPPGHSRQATSQRGANRSTSKATFRLCLVSVKALLRTTVDKQGVKEKKPGDLYCFFTAALLLTEMGEQSSPYQRSLTRICCLIRMRMLPHTCVCTNKETETGEQSSPCQRRQTLLAPLLVRKREEKKRVESIRFLSSGFCVLTDVLLE